MLRRTFTPLPHDITIPGVFALAADADTTCQGAEFTKAVQVSAQTR